jgi:hypothetical protein
MMKATLIVVIILLGYNAFSQGCSDAGACSAGSLRLRDYGQNGTRFLMDYTQSIGLADKESLVLSTELTMSHRLSSTTGFEVRIPYLVTIGNLGSTSGVGDLLVSVSHVILHTGKSAYSVVAGGRFFSNDASKKIDGQPLPMVYQSSLGTNDIITGLAWHSEKWRLSLAYQHPFGSNQNEYLHGDSIHLPDNKRYFESAYLKRGDDLMLRVQRTFNYNPASQMAVGMLPVYRLQPDEIRRNGSYEKLSGSEGLTFNLYFNWLWYLDENKQIKVSSAFPVFARKYRADGLTRTAIISAGLIFQFSAVAQEVQPIHDLFDYQEH